MTPSEAPRTRPVPRFEWEKELLRVKTSASSVKFIGLAAATYATGRSGGNIHPGVKRLAEECGVSPSTVQRGLSELKRLGFLAQVRKGRSLGRGSSGGLASEYQLTVPMAEEAEKHRAPVTGEYGKDQALVTGEYQGNQQSNGHKHRSNGAKTPVNLEETPRTGDRPSRKLTPKQEAPEHESSLGYVTMSPRSENADLDHLNLRAAHRLLCALEREVAELWVKDAGKELGEDAEPDDIITLAALRFQETRPQHPAVQKTREWLAAAIHERLRRGMS